MVPVQEVCPPISLKVLISEHVVEMSAYVHGLGPALQTPLLSVQVHCGWDVIAFRMNRFGGLLHCIS